MKCVLSFFCFGLPGVFEFVVREEVPNGKPIWICKVCNFQANRKNHTVEHYLYKHAPDENIPCKWCGKIFNKRPTSGSGSVSRPFEYLSRLSQFLSDRVFTGRTKVRKNHTKNPRLALITRRQSDSGQRWSGCSWCETGRDYVVRRGRCYTTPCHHIAETTEPPHILRQTLSALFFHADFTFKWMDINSKLDSTIQNI